MNHQEIKAATKVVGVKSAMRAVEKGQCKTVLIAKDAQEHVVAPLLQCCEKNGVEVLMIDEMAVLGELCTIKVPAAAAGIL